MRYKHNYCWIPKINFSLDLLIIITRVCVNRIIDTKKQILSKTAQGNE